MHVNLAKLFGSLEDQIKWWARNAFANTIEIYGEKKKQWNDLRVNFACVRLAANP